MLILPIAQLALFAASWFGPWRDAPERHNNGRLPVQARMLLSFSLVAVAWFIWLGHASRMPVYSQWVAVGMLVAFIGDLIMARLIRVPNRLIGGMLAFGIAYALYAYAYNSTIQTISALEPYSRFQTGLIVGLGGYGLLVLAGWWFLIRNPQKGTVINVGALVYGLLIGAMASFALALGYALGFWLTALGGLLLVVSDLLVGMKDVRGTELTNMNDWVWLTYVLGQMGIIYAASFI